MRFEGNTVENRVNAADSGIVLGGTTNCAGVACRVRDLGGYEAYEVVAVGNTVTATSPGSISSGFAFAGCKDCAIDGNHVANTQWGIYLRSGGGTGWAPNPDNLNPLIANGVFDGCAEDAVHVEAVSGALSFAGNVWGSCPHPPFDDGTAGVAGAPFRDAAGLIVVEAESAHGRVARYGQAWIVESGLAGFVGTGYAKAEWDRGQRYATDYARRAPQLTFTVSFAAAGTYYVWVRMAADSGASDSIHLGLDGQEDAGAANVAAVAADGSWRWASATGDGPPAALVVAAAGTHAVNLWAREDGVAVDRLILTTDAAYVPSGDGPAASARLSAAEPAASIVVERH